MSFFSHLLGGSSSTLSPAAFVARRDASAPVLDVRTPAEYREGHLAGAVNVDVTAADFRTKAAALGLPTDGPVYVYCRSGARSGRAAKILSTMGHRGAVSVGGFGPLARAGAQTA